MKQPELPEDVGIQRADPAARRRALWLVAGGVAFALALGMALSLYQDEIEHWIQANGAELIAQPGTVYLIAILFMLPMVALAVYVFSIASRVVKAQRIPLPGQKVIKDTPVITGSKAVRQGRAMQLVAVVMAVIGVAMPLLLAVLLMMLQKEI